MYRAANQYDSYDRQGPKIFCEWASAKIFHETNMNAALGDAAWMTCMELQLGYLNRSLLCSSVCQCQ